MSRSRRFLFLFSLVFSPLLFAASADLAVDVAVVGVPVNGLTSELTLDLRNNGPDEAASIVVLWGHRDGPPMETADARCTRTATGGLRCELASLAANETVRFRATKRFDGEAQRLQEMRATVTAATPDPNAENNERIFLYVPATPPGDVIGTIENAGPFLPDGTITLRYRIRNQNPDWPATLIANLAIPGAIAFVSSNAPCRATGGDGVNLECTLAAVPSSTTFALDVVVRYPEPAGRVASVMDVFWAGYPGVIVHHEREQLFPRTFLVTSTADSGPGSLRDTLLDANVRCADGVLCRVHFAIAEPVPASGWFTIRLLTPLPVITAPVIALDAVTQTTIADTNPHGPEVQLDGSALAEGHGLEFRGAEAITISGFAIGNFRANGIQGAPRTFTITRNYIGVDPTGHHPMPNIRGVAMESGHGTLTDNVLSGNLRSGAFFVNVASLLVQRNRIGVPAANDDHMPNWASGVYVGRTSQGFISRVEFAENVIAHNRDFGIALGREVLATVGVNRIFDHSQGAVDIGLDGPTLTLAPVLERVYRDGSATVVEGTTPARVTGPISTSYAVAFYANTTRDANGFSETERYLGTAAADATGRFTFRHEGDLRGLFVNAMTVRTTNYYGEFTGRDTSELSAAVAAP
jgi:hypothetical protein